MTLIQRTKSPYYVKDKKYTFQITDHSKSDMNWFKGYWVFIMVKEE